MEPQKEKEMNYIDAEKVYEHLEQVGGLYPRFAENTVDNVVINVINDIKNFISSLQQEQPEGKLEKDKCLGCNNIKGCVTCVDGNQWAHTSEVGEEEELRCAICGKSLNKDDVCEDEGGYYYCDVCYDEFTRRCEGVFNNMKKERGNEVARRSLKLGLNTRKK